MKKQSVIAVAATGWATRSPKKKKARILHAFMIAFFLGNICQAQYSTFQTFIPAGYLAYETYFGDLNQDALEDCVLIIKATREEKVVTNRFDKVVDRNRRGIIVLLKKEAGYQYVGINPDCFFSENEDGGVYFPPELWIDFYRGNLRINYAHGRYGYWKYTFRYQDKTFKLIGFDATNTRGPVINHETSINFLTKKKLLRENTNLNADSGEEVFKETRSDIEINSLLDLFKISDFDKLNMYAY